MVLGHNDSFKLSSPSPISDEAFGSVDLAQCIGCTDPT
jgi:hypothetical protein